MERTQQAIDEAVRTYCKTDQQEMWLRALFTLVHSDGRMSGIESCRSKLETSEMVKIIEEMRKEVFGEAKVDS